MDFTTKLFDRFGRMWQSLKQQQANQQQAQQQHVPAGENINAGNAAAVFNSIADRDGPGDGGGRLTNSSVPYPTQQNQFIQQHTNQPYTQPGPQYSLPLTAPAPPPPLPLNVNNHSQQQQTPQHHQQQHSTSTTPSPAYPPSQSSSSISSTYSPAHLPPHPPLTGVASSSAGISSHQHQHQHQHQILVNSSSQPIMTNSNNNCSSATSPHYPFSLGSSTSNSPSSIVSPTPPPPPHSAGPHGLPPSSGSFSAAQTPESPSLGFRRQLSLNIFQRERHFNKPSSGGLQLDFAGRSSKGGKSQGGSGISGVSPFSASNDIIDCHSLSPRPRPKNLGLSNSHDNINISKNTMHHNNSTSGPGHLAFTGFHPSGASASARHHRSNFNFNFSNSPSASGGGGGGGHSVRSQFYPNPPSARLKEEFANKNNRTIKINGKKYENIKEDDFKKLSELGSGSFGQVEKMLHKPSNMELAVKKMRRSGNQDDNKHIINDLELLRKCVDFANIVQCYGYYIMETEVWIFMELMTTCFDRLLKRLAKKAEQVPEKIIGKIAVSTVSTLDYLKVNHGVIHRDIKPSNILINRQGIIKLCDFGISGRLIDSKAHSRSVGCAAYMAPERIQPPDSTGTYDIRSDVWSLGITLVEIATGQFPYQNFNSDFELLSKVIQDEPPTLPFEGGFSEEFRGFIRKCLTKDYARRPKYKELMEHKFYIDYMHREVDVAEWFNHAYDETDSIKSSTSSLASASNH